MICRNCGKDVLEKAVYCGNCGNRIVRNIICENCGFELEESDKFCGNCGSKIQDKNGFGFNPKDNSRKNVLFDKIIDRDSRLSNGDAMVVASPEPLTNEVLKIKKVYYIFSIFIILGIFNDYMLGIGFLGSIVWFLLDYFITEKKLRGLRKKKFKISSEASAEKIFNGIQSSLLSKYNGSIEVDEDEENVIISYKEYRYDVYINEDDTFSIWWRKTLKSTFFPTSNYRDYKNNLMIMGIIAYEVQCALNIIEAK